MNHFVSFFSALAFLLFISCSEKKPQASFEKVATTKDFSISKQENITTGKKNDLKRIVHKKQTETISIPEKKPAISTLQPDQLLEEKAMDSLYKALDKIAEVFFIDTSKDTAFTCAEGTIISIPANCFIDKNRKKVTGIIRFEVKEYYATSDMLMASLNSVSDEQLMESGGMLYLQASSNEKTLSITTGKTVTVEMPTTAKDERMQLFYGEGHHRNLNWKKSKKSSQALPSGSRMSINIADIVYYSKNNQEKIEIASKGNVHSLSPEIVERADTLMVSFQMDNKGRLKNYQISLNNKKTARPRVKVGYTKNVTPLSSYVHFINANNDISFGRDYKFNYALSKLPFHGLPVSSGDITLTEENLHKLKKAFKRSDSTITVTLCKIYTATNDRILLKAKKERLAKMGKDTTAVTSNGGSQYNIFALDKLQWINCDRFYDTPAINKTNYRIATNESSSEDVKIIFNDFKSIMNGKQTDKSIHFKSIPKSTGITVVAVRYKNSKFEFATTKTTTSDKQTNLHYFPTNSIDEIRDKIAEAVK